MGGRKNCANCAVIARARRTVGLGRDDLEGAAAELEALERAERGARVVVDAPLVRLVRDAVEPLRRQQQHALLLHAPLVHREHRPPGEQRLALADGALVHSLSCIPVRVDGDSHFLLPLAMSSVHIMIVSFVVRNLLASLDSVFDWLNNVPPQLHC